MIAELVAVGSELLRFGRYDSNGVWLTERLQRLGIEVVRRTLVGDDLPLIAVTVRHAIHSADLVVVTGGLGPTEDDRTREGLALALELELERDDERVRLLRSSFESRGRKFRDLQARQADRPTGSEWLDNGLGTAPGILFKTHRGLLIALPGVPAEMTRMFELDVAPRLAGMRTGGLARRVLKVGGRFEASVDEQVRDLYATPGVEVTILTGREGIELHLLGSGSDDTSAGARLDGLDRELAARLGADLIGRDDETLSGVVGRLLLAEGSTVATAESCTAGLLAARITETPGSSAWFRGGLVVYADDLKTGLAGVSPELIRDHGAVSEEVARGLAEGARSSCGAVYGVGITGTAGPGGERPGKPVGLVHVALADPRRTEHWRVQQVGDRHLVRSRSVAFALDRLRRRLLEGATRGAGR